MTQKPAAKSKPSRKRPAKKPEWYQTRPIYAASAALALLLMYTAGSIAIDTANLFAYSATIIFLVLAIRNAILTVRPKG